jgi:hypothetical protein
MATNADDPDTPGTTRTETEASTSDPAATAPDSHPAAEPVTFDDPDDRQTEMDATIDEWVDRLATAAEEARQGDVLQEYLDVQARFHDYSFRNTLLIHQQLPDATRVAGYQTWQEMDRQVQAGESAIWIYAPITASKCPECGNSPSWHEDGKTDCEYHEESNPEAWGSGVVGFKPVPVFDISQTEGEPLPELDTAAEGDGTALRYAVEDACENLPVEYDAVPARQWSHGQARGVCKGIAPYSADPVIEVKERADDAAFTGVLVHELAHALLHYPELRDSDERAKREVEAEAVAYVVCQHFGLDASGASLYLAAWSEDPTDILEERLERIRETSERLIEAIDDQHSPQSPG